MAGGTTGHHRDSVEEASAAYAGEPASASDAAFADDVADAPTPEDLDARERNFARPRKPMGPVADEVPETRPEEG